MLVINAVDQQGKTIDLRRFDVDAVLSVAAVDPAEQSGPPIARWEFSRGEVQQLIGDEPASGLKVGVRWPQDRPALDEVVIHARLKAEDEVLRCQARLKIGAPEIATWTPRATATRKE